VEKRLHECALGLIHAGLLRSAHDVSDGGIIVALIESANCGVGGMGFEVELENDRLRMDYVLFGEEQSRIIISAEVSKRAEIMDVCLHHEIPCTVIGSVTRTASGIVRDGVTIDLIAAKKIMDDAIGERMEEVFSQTV
jgi:phosphoribosylformylglycinamidine synthase